MEQSISARGPGCGHLEPSYAEMPNSRYEIATLRPTIWQADAIELGALPIINANVCGRLERLEIGIEDELSDGTLKSNVERPSIVRVRVERVA
jgi:hypothetical protein